jgi:predicted DNA-binding transcriptional regulator YafY
MMLQDIGIPVEAERGPYGAYQLRRGYKLPPLMFTDSEAIALTLGLLAIREFHFPVDVAAVEGALAKTERVMPEKLFQQARALQEAITFNVTPPPTLRETGFVAMLSSAVRQRQRIHMHYQAWNGDKSERDFDAYGIVFNEGYWYTAGYCHLRQDLRTFRLDRITDLEPGKVTFERPADFDVLAHVLDSITKVSEGAPVEVLLETTLEQAQQALSPLTGTFEQVGNGVIFRRGAYQLEWVAHMLISLDFPVYVKQPEELREMLRRMAVRALQIAEESVSGEQ